MTEKTKERLEAEIKNTVGYLEAQNKRSFEVGVQVAISKVADYYKQQILLLEQQLEYFKAQSITFENDLRTMSRIIHQYNYE